MYRISISRVISCTPFLRQKFQVISSISRTLNNNNQGVLFLSPVSHLLLLYLYSIAAALSSTTFSLKVTV